MLFLIKSSREYEGHISESIDYVIAQSIKEAITKWESSSAWNKERNINQIEKMANTIISEKP